LSSGREEALELAEEVALAFLGVLKGESELELFLQEGGLEKWDDPVLSPSLPLQLLVQL
jgi:hypothetical protein